MNRRAWRAGYSPLGHKELNTTEQLTLYMNKKQGFTVYHREFCSKPHNTLLLTMGTVHFSEVAQSTL